ncbi:MAG: hypothetical protein RLZZ308_491 [Candidatus Parcubacteria bacterium]|jgi:hypothetical protein
MSFLKGSQQCSYVGVTDFTTYDQVEVAKRFIHKDSHRMLHVGAMMSYKTFHGIPTERKWETIWLKPKGLQKLFMKDPTVFNVLHWADYVTYPKTSSEDLITACTLSGSGLSGLQLDMVWPHISLLEDVKKNFPHLSIILQVSKIAINDSRKRGVTLLSDVLRYKDCADYILVDYGMGSGRPFNPEEVLTVLGEVSKAFPEHSLAVAGGIGPETVHLLDPILREYPKISFDAQGQLRRSGNALHPIEMDRVKAYVRATTSLTAKYAG